MATHVVVLSNEQIKQLQAHLVNELVAPPHHAHFRATFHGVTITAYHSGKVTLQGLQASEVWQLLAQQLSLAPKIDATPTTKQPQKNSLPSDFAQRSIIGSDEVGNGSYFGALTVAATYAASDRLALLREIGVKDSKTLSDKQIQTIATQIKACIPYKILVVSPEKYNQTHSEMNLNIIKAKLHNQALYLLLKKIDPSQVDGILIDQFCEPKTYYRYLSDEETVIRDRVYFATKAEQYHLAVAAASILARDAFLTNLQQLEQRYHLKLPSGAGKQVDQAAARVLQKGGIDLLQQVAKVHFANTKKAQALLDQQDS